MQHQSARPEGTATPQNHSTIRTGCSVSADTLDSACPIQKPQPGTAATRPSATSAHHAAADAITIPQRRARIGLNLAILQRRMPEGWQGWSHTQLTDFRNDLQALSRSRCHGSLSDLLLVADRVARAYGESLATIDPCYGEPA